MKFVKSHNVGLLNIKICKKKETRSVEYLVSFKMWRLKKTENAEMTQTFFLFVIWSHLVLDT